MKHLALSFLSFLFLSCQSSHGRIIAQDQDRYQILKEQEFMVVLAPYAILKSEPSLSASTLNLLRKGSLLRVLSTKQAAQGRNFATWFYAEKVENPSEKGWLLSTESLLSPTIYRARYLSSHPNILKDGFSSSSIF